MTEPRAIVDRMTEILAAHPLQPHREIRCGYAILQWLKSKAAPPATGSGVFLGAPVIFDQDLGRGTWVYVEDGIEVQRHAIGDGDRVWFVAGQFITTDDDEIAEGFDQAARDQAGL